MFGKKYIYVGVCFFGSRHPYSYRTTDSSIRINNVVIVPTPEGEKAAIVTSVGRYREKEVPYPLDKTKFIIRKANHAERKEFAGVDMRMPLDISTKRVKTYSGEAIVITDKTERDSLRKYYSGRADVKIIETYPKSQAGRIIERNDAGKKNKIAVLYHQEHLWGEETYECSECRAVFATREAFCPRCHAEFYKTKYDPVWVDEMAEYDGDI